MSKYLHLRGVGGVDSAEFHNGEASASEENSSGSWKHASSEGMAEVDRKQKRIANAQMFCVVFVFFSSVYEERYSGKTSSFDAGRQV